VLRGSRRDVVRLADVEQAIRATNDVGEIHHDDDAIVVVQMSLGLHCRGGGGSCAESGNRRLPVEA
jgi:hypothetical protein